MTADLKPEDVRRMKAIIAAQWMTEDDEKFLSALIAAGWTPSALRAAGWTPSALRAAGWTPSALIAAGWTPSALRAAGWTPSDLRAAGWTPSDLRAAGWTPSDLRAAGWTPSDLIAAGWTPSDLRESFKNVVGNFDDLPPIPRLEKPYSKLLAEIHEGKRLHNQADFGPRCDPKTNLCKTQMCTAGHLVNMAGKAGYDLLKAVNNDFSTAALLIHMESCPNVPPQNFGSISQEAAMAYIEQRAAEEAENAG